MLTDEQIAILDEVFRTGDVHAALLAHDTTLPRGESAAARATRVRCWQALRADPSAKEYLTFLRQDALANGGVPLGEHIADLKGDIEEAKSDLVNLRRIVSQTPGVPSAMASLHGTILKARELQARASGLHGKREGTAPGDDDSDDGAKVRGVKVEWV